MGGESVVSDLLDQIQQEIVDRLAQLQPMVDEHRRLEAAASALAELGGSRAPSTTGKKPHPAKRRQSGDSVGRARRVRAVATLPGEPDEHDAPAYVAGALGGNPGGNPPPRRTQLARTR
jgi:hypothetical protein